MASFLVSVSVKSCTIWRLRFFGHNFAAVCSSRADLRFFVTLGQLVVRHRETHGRGVNLLPELLLERFGIAG
jgi:hypothetical protein